MTCLIRSLAGPVRGMRSMSFGFAERMRYGNAMPEPTAAKTVRIVPGPCVVAHATAVPISGAVHGVESTAVITPKRNDPQ